MVDWEKSKQGREAYEHLMALMTIFRRIDREDLEDSVTDIADFVVGWCSSHMRVEWPEDPPEESVSIEKTNERTVNEQGQSSEDSR